MKKIIALILALIMALGLVACGAKAPADTDAPADADSSVVSIASKSVYGQEWGQKRLGGAAAKG